MLSFSAEPRVAEHEMRAMLFILVAVAHADGHFDASERAFLRDTVDALIERRARESFPGDLPAQADVVPRWRAHFYGAIAGIENEVRASLTESVPVAESIGEYVAGRLELRCFEMLQTLGSENRAALLRLVDELIRADGRVDPGEQHFRDEIERLFDDEPTHTYEPAPQSIRGGATIFDEPRERPLHEADHPFFQGAEVPYASDPATFARQAAADIELIRQFGARLAELRVQGQGRLGAATTFAAFAGQAPFLDGWVQVVPTRPGVEIDALVLGDLHGCHSCLKAALMQDGFFARVEAYRRDPQRTTFPMLVLLGDYIDRGAYSYDGVLRTVLRLFLAAPEHVIALRGNHEQYMVQGDRILSPVVPAEAIASIAPLAPRMLLDAHRALFEALPSVAVVGETICVHGGVPRDEALRAKLRGVAALNDAELRQQMAWSDPSDADDVPAELQQKNARFPFGRAQFRRFMEAIGCTTMIRGHERVVEGVRRVYREPRATLITLFSAGGATNDDLPPTSNYREVTPMALTLRIANGITRLTPFPIAYARYADPAVNGFARARAAAAAANANRR